MKKIMVFLYFAILTLILVGCSNNITTNNLSETNITTNEIDCNINPSHDLCKDQYDEPQEIKEYTNAPLFQGEIEGEALKPSLPSCFSGAWYRKVVSSKDKWYGIEGTIRLGDFTGDANRHQKETTNGIYFNRFLDNPSVYMGGNAGAESDVGLSWTVGCDNKYCYPTPNGYNTERFTYRPFWRWIGEDESGKYGNHYRNSDYTKLEYYYFPGDLVKMSIINTKPGYLRMRIELLEETTIEKYTKIREGFQIPENASRIFLSPEFPSVGYGEENFVAEFKRVNAIDQVGNEGKPAQSTNAEVSKASWQSVYLFRRIDDKLYKVPFVETRAAYMTCPSSNAFIIDNDNLDSIFGGENISIIPNLVD